MGLILGGVSASDLILDGQPVSLYVGGSPPVKVWPTRETVQITLGAGTEARDQLRAALSDRDLDYATVTEIPFDIELVGSRSAYKMFQGCAALTHLPDLDTSQVTDMYSMFRDCAALTHVPAMDTSQVTNMRDMFRGCSSLTSVPDMDTSQVTTMYFMFGGCTSLTHAPAMDTSSVVNMYGMFYSCSSLTHVPDMDTSQVRDMYAMFFNCSSLTSVSDMDTSSVTNMEYMFHGCAALTYVPDLDTSQVTSTFRMFYNCAALTDGNVRLIGRNPNVNTTGMIDGSGLTREPWYKADGTPDEVVQITGASGTTSRNQLRDAVAERGLDYRTVTHLPFEIDTSQATSLLDLFSGWVSLVVAPEMTTSQVTDMGGLFRGCTALEYVGDLQTSNVTNAGYMFNECPALTDGNVRLIGKHPNVSTTAMITNSGLTREPWYRADGTPVIIEVHNVTLTNVWGNGTAHPLVSVAVPAGETWAVTIEGTVTRASDFSDFYPRFRIGAAVSGVYGQDVAVDFSGTVTDANSTIALITSGYSETSFTGTVTIDK